MEGRRKDATVRTVFHPANTVGFLAGRGTVFHPANTVGFLDAPRNTPPRGTKYTRLYCIAEKLALLIFGLAGALALFPPKLAPSRLYYYLLPLTNPIITMIIVSRP